MVKIAVFDIDGTIRNKSLTESFVEYLIKQGYIARRKEEELRAQRRKYKAKDSKEEYDNYTKMLSEALITAISGLSELDLAVLANQAVREYEHEDYSYTKRVIKALRSAGYKMIVVSGSIDFLVKEFGKQYKFDVYHGHGYEPIEDNKYRFCEPVSSHNKENIINKIIHDYGWKDVIESYVAVGDTAGDFTMMEQAGHSIAINPSEELVDLMVESAKKGKTWHVVSERKKFPNKSCISPDQTGQDRVLLTNAMFLKNKNDTGLDFLNPSQKFENFKLLTDFTN